MENVNKPVWDIFIRFFHWTLVLAFAIAYITEGEVPLHFYVGWYIGVLMVLRVLWGFIGSQHARFSDFVKPPGVIIRYAKSLRSGDKHKIAHYRGHNPLGGAMVIALLLFLSITVASGIALYAGENDDLFAFTAQPILQEEHHESSDAGEEHEHEENLVKEIHELFANLTLLLIGLHLAGVVLSGRLHNENLVRAMITGKKE